MKRWEKTSAKEMLEILDHWAQVQYQEGNHGEVRRLYDVLSVIRGPDNMDSNVKNSTTAIIRQVAFPWVAHLGATVRFFTVEEINESDAQRSGYHFQDHICSAKHALVAMGYK